MSKQHTTNKPLKKAAVKAKKKTAKHVPHGVVHVKASFNNTIVSICDTSGNVISWRSAGSATTQSFKGSRKSSAFAATVAAQEAGRVAMSYGMTDVEVNLNGPGPGRESALRGIQSAGLRINAIHDKTPVPHNGCRAPKRRRV